MLNNTARAVYHIAYDFGCDVLHHGLLGQAGYMLQIEPVLEPLEGFLDAPAPVIKVAEDAGGKAPGIEQIGHQDTYLVVGSDMTRAAVGRKQSSRTAAIGSQKQTPRFNDLLAFLG